MKPHVIDKIVNHDTGKVIRDVTPEVVSTPISAETAKEVRDILETVVYITKKGYRVIDIKSMGIVCRKNRDRKYSRSKGRLFNWSKDYIFSFLGMAPADDPKLIVYVAVQQPDIERLF